MSRKRIKQYLMLLTVVGLIAIAANGSGTFASFSAETTNAGNTFATGTLILKDGTCSSAAGTLNKNDNCTAVLTASGLHSNAYKTADITLQNAGTLDASGLTFSGTCTSAAVDNSVTFNTGATTLCGDLKVDVVETDSSFDVTNHAISCAYGTAAATGNGCDLTQAGTLQDLADLGSPASLNLSSSSSGNTGGELDAGAYRYFVVEVQADDLGNADQNSKATFGLTWHADENTAS